MLFHLIFNVLVRKGFLYNTSTLKLRPPSYANQYAFCTSVPCLIEDIFSNLGVQDLIFFPYIGLIKGIIQMLCIFTNVLSIDLLLKALLLKSSTTMVPLSISHFNIVIFLAEAIFFIHPYLCRMEKS